MKEALLQLKKSGGEGCYPRGCIHDEEKTIRLDASDHYHTVRICGECLEELYQKTDN